MAVEVKNNNNKPVSEVTAGVFLQLLPAVTSLIAMRTEEKHASTLQLKRHLKHLKQQLGKLLTASMTLKLLFFHTYDFHI